MTAITAIVRCGRLEVQVPEDWPDGTNVEISPIDPDRAAAGDGPMTADEIARTLAAMELVEPLEFTKEEEAAIEAARQERKQWAKDNFNERASKLAEDWN